MQKYGEFQLINTLAKVFNYTHEQVFNLSWREAYTIHALEQESAYIEIKASEMYHEMESNK